MLEIQAQFRQYLTEHCASTGFEIPTLLEDYLVGLLAARLRDTEIIPQPSFAERYLEIQQLDRAHLYQQFADQCLFFVSLLPEYGRRRGLDIDYYSSLGISAYYSVGDRIQDDRFIQLGNWFYDLQRLLHSAIVPHKPLAQFDRYFSHFELDS